MKNIKSWFSSFVLITVIWFSSMGFVTKGLWDYSSPSSYNDTIISFYTTPQKNEIIFLGNKYHYFFNKGTVLLNEVLKDNNFLGLQKNNLSINTYINSDASVVTNIFITFNLQNISKAQKDWLNYHDFIQIGNTPMESKLISLERKQYKASVEVNQEAIKIKEPISIEVSEYLNNTAGKVLLTSLAAGTDALLIVAGVILSPLLLFIK